MVFALNDLHQMIGNTPPIKLKKVSAATGCEIYGKCEFQNPGGSIKDKEVVSKARDLGVNMIFTGVRHFKH